MKDFWKTYGDIIIFMATLFISNWIWKGIVIGDDDSTEVLVFGHNVLPWFQVLCVHITDDVYALIHLFRDTIHRVGPDLMRWENGHGTRIIWGCTPVKQIFIWTIIMLTTPYGKWHKIWYIPLGAVLLYYFNILRITIITLITEFHPEWFTFLHTYLFKYIFYGFMLLLWVAYVEWFRRQKEEKNK